MLSTRNIVNSYKDVPPEWMFEHYCGLSEKLTGQDVSISSIFSDKDLIPSMKIYMTENGYRFKDFSSGHSGNCWDLVIKILNKSFHEAAREVEKTYTQYLFHNKPRQFLTEFTVGDRYKVTSYVKRGWEKKDADFWVKFNISSNLLTRYNVSPLLEYTMTKLNCVDLNFQHGLYYGYFNKDNVLIKIYQPFNKDLKFVNVNKYLQGQDQLMGYENLCIASSLKDIMSCVSLGIKVDFIAPDSENTFISKTTIDYYLKKYKYISVMLDNDEAGIKAMKRYREEYNIFPLLLNMSKDVSDSVRDYGPKKVLSKIVPLFEKLSLALSDDY